MRILLALFFIFAIAGLSHASDKEIGLNIWSSNPAKAIELWRSLAEAGDAESMLFIAFAYRTGQGVAQDNQQAFHWYQKAAEAGMPEAQFQLALMYELGLGTDTDPDTAAGWYALATEGDFCPSELPAGGRLGDR